MTCVFHETFNYFFDVMFIILWIADKLFPRVIILHNLFCSYSLFEVDARALGRSDCSANFTQTSSKDDVMAVVDILGGRNHIRDNTDYVENVGHFLLEKVSILLTRREHLGRNYPIVLMICY